MPNYEGPLSSTLQQGAVEVSESRNIIEDGNLVSAW